jgi:hypothetical protein
MYHIRRYDRNKYTIFPKCRTSGFGYADRLCRPLTAEGSQVRCNTFWAELCAVATGEDV